MDNKKFISEIQKRTGIDKSKIVDMVNTMTKVISEQCINLNSVKIDNLGTFIPKKRLEFISKDPSSNNYFLYPPRISARFSVDKILIDKLNNINHNE